MKGMDVSRRFWTAAVVAVVLSSSACVPKTETLLLPDKPRPLPGAEASSAELAARANQKGDYLGAEDRFKKARTELADTASPDGVRLRLQQAVNRSSLGRLIQADQDLREAFNEIWISTRSETNPAFECAAFSGGSEPDGAGRDATGPEGKPRFNDRALRADYYRACALHLANKASQPKKVSKPITVCFDGDEPVTLQPKGNSLVEPDVSYRNFLNCSRVAAERAQSLYEAVIRENDPQVFAGDPDRSILERLTEDGADARLAWDDRDARSFLGLRQASLVALFHIADLYDLCAQFPVGLSSTSKANCGAAPAKLTMASEILMKAIGVDRSPALNRIRQTRARVARSTNDRSDAVNQMHRVVAATSIQGTDAQDAPHNADFGATILGLGGALRRDEQPRTADRAFEAGSAILKAAIEDDRPGLPSELVMPYVDHLFQRLPAASMESGDWRYVAKDNPDTREIVGQFIQALQLIAVPEPEREYRTTWLQSELTGKYKEKYESLENLRWALEENERNLLKLTNQASLSARSVRDQLRKSYNDARSDLKKAAECQGIDEKDGECRSLRRVLDGDPLLRPRVVSLNDIHALLAKVPDEAVWLVAMGPGHGYHVLVTGKGISIYKISQPLRNIEDSNAHLRERYSASAAENIEKFYRNWKASNATAGQQNSPKHALEEWKNNTNDLRAAISSLILPKNFGRSFDLLMSGAEPNHSGGSLRSDCNSLEKSLKPHVNVIEIGLVSPIPFGILSFDEETREKLQGGCRNNKEYFVEFFSYARYSTLSRFLYNKSRNIEEAKDQPLSYAFFGAPKPPSLRELSLLSESLQRRACSPRDDSIYGVSDTGVIKGLYSNSRDMAAVSQRHLQCLGSILETPRSIQQYAGERFTADAAVNRLFSTSVTEFLSHGVLGGRLLCSGEGGIAVTPKPLTEPRRNEDFLLLGRQIALEGRKRNSEPAGSAHDKIVMLQACDSAEAETAEAGDRVSTLTGAFHFSGARAVIAAEWPLPIESAFYSTERFMAKYKDLKQRLDDGHGAGKASPDSTRLAAGILSDIQAEMIGNWCEGDVIKQQFDGPDQVCKSPRACEGGGTSGLKKSDPWNWGGIVVSGG